MRDFKENLKSYFEKDVKASFRCKYIFFTIMVIRDNHEIYPQLDAVFINHFIECRNSDDSEVKIIG